MSVFEYVDFDENLPPNTIWTWKKDGDGGWNWSKVTLGRMIAGDTDSGMFTIPQSVIDEHSIEEVVKLADAIGESVNQSFPEMCEFAFNCPPDRNKIITTDREIVSDKSFFLTKKRYVMHVVNDEGKWVDKLKIQGVEIKKSDTSEITRRFLTELVDMILNHVPRDEVLDRIEGMRKEFYKASPFEVSVAVSTNTLGKIQEAYRTTGSIKGAHYGAKAALFWNLLKDDVDPDVFPGQKVGVVYVKNKHTNCIGYPVDMEELPKWFLDIPLDYDRMWSGLKVKLDNYLSVMGWDLKNRKKLKRESMFGL